MRKQVKTRRDSIAIQRVTYTCQGLPRASKHHEMIPVLWKDMSQGFALRFPRAAAMTAASLGKLSQSVVQKDKHCALGTKLTSLFLNLFPRNALMPS